MPRRQAARKRAFSFEGYVGGDEPYLDEAGSAYQDFAWYKPISFFSRRESLYSGWRTCQGQEPPRRMTSQ